MDADDLLALLNTSPVVDGRRTELLDGAWLAELGDAGVGVGVGAARRVRDDVQAVVRGDASPDSLAPYLARVRRTPVLTGGGLDWRMNADWPARVVLAWGQCHADLPGRLRPCANDECRLFLLDRSRPGTARWCSMSGCGNRMKARRHHRRTVDATD